MENRKYMNLEATGLWIYLLSEWTRWLVRSSLDRYDKNKTVKVSKPKGKQSFFCLQLYFSKNYLTILEINDRLKGEGWTIKIKTDMRFFVKYVTKSAIINHF